jgi:hypothetical protein
MDQGAWFKTAPTTRQSRGVWLQGKRQVRATVRIESLSGKPDDAKGNVFGITNKDLINFTNTVITGSYSRINTSNNMKTMQAIYRPSRRW